MAKINRIILVRHGYSMGNHDADNYQKYGDSNVPLHAKGVQQAVNAGQFLAQYLKDNPGFSNGKPRIWTSPFLRTQETTAGIVHGGNGHFDDCEIRETPFLVEQSFGVFSHIHDREDQKERLPVQAEFHTRGLGQSKFMTPKPMGDSPFDIYKNVSHFLDTAHRDAQKGINDIVCVSHGVTTRILPMRLFNWSMRALEHFPNPHNCDVMVIERDAHNQLSFLKVYDGENGSTQVIDLAQMILSKAPLLGAETLPCIKDRLTPR